MTEESRRGGGSEAWTPRLIEKLARDLADLARAQAKLTTDLVDLLEGLRAEAPEIPLHIPPGEADREDRIEAGSGEGGGAPAPAEVGEGAGEAPGRGSDEGEEIPEGEESRDLAVEIEEAADEGEDEEAEEVPDSLDTTVLVLESGDARVGVLWDQVVQIGSFSERTVPERIESEHGAVDLVSLGRLLHGVSREEKYFVVLADEGEKAAVACERMLGLGPLASVSKHEQDERIQVLQVRLLRSFAGGADLPVETGPAEGARETPEEREREERDRNGPRRALVAVRYLPARVAICRYLRGRGWQVGEAAGLDAAIVSLDLGRWDALFLDARVNGTPDEAEEALLSRVGELGVPVIRVGSRISGYPGHSGPSLMFPFSETELESILHATEARPGA